MGGKGGGRGEEGTKREKEREREWGAGEGVGGRTNGKEEFKKKEEKNASNTLGEGRKIVNFPSLKVCGKFFPFDVGIVSGVLRYSRLRLHNAVILKIIIIEK